MLRRPPSRLATLAVVAVPGAARAESLTIQVTSVVVTLKPYDKLPKGSSTATGSFHDKLLNVVRQFGKPKGMRVGEDRGTMTFTSAHTARFDGRVTLPGGTIRIKGP